MWVYPQRASAIPLATAAFHPTKQCYNPLNHSTQLTIQDTHMKSQTQLLISNLYRHKSAKFTLGIVFFLFVLVATGCQTEVTLPPTEPPAMPSQTALPPTATPIPHTDTLPPPTETAPPPEPTEVPPRPLETEQ